VSVVDLGGEIAGRKDVAHRLETELLDELEDGSQVATRRAESRHHAEQDVTLRPGDAQELRHGIFGALEDVADWPAVADGRVEGAVLELREVDDVDDVPRLDLRLQAGSADLLAVQLELPRRDVRDDDPSAVGGELDREPAGPGADLEHAISLVDVLVQ
jgi:hypothetical protein